MKPIKLKPTVKFRCPECGALFKNKKELNKHLKARHGKGFWAQLLNIFIKFSP